jgi:hypothetical protein
VGDGDGATEDVRDVSGSFQVFGALRATQSALDSEGILNRGVLFA